MSTGSTSNAPSSSSKTIVVFGATGQQGTALIKALAKINSNASSTSDIPFKLVALTRNAATPSATRLSALPGVRVIPVQKNIMEEPEKEFERIGLVKGEIYGVFSVQGYVNEVLELQQGKAIIDAAHVYGVKHFVYSSVDFGGVPDTGASSFEVKRKIETHLKSKQPPLPYTILRPSQFMDNLLPTSQFLFKISRTMLLRKTFYENPNRKHQMISTRDIGIAGARAFEEPDKYLGKEIRLAGDQFTMSELEMIYLKTMGKPIELTYEFVAGFVQWAIPPLAQMSRFFDKYGYNIDVAQCHEEFPEMEDLRSFLIRYKESQK